MRVGCGKSCRQMFGGWGCDVCAWGAVSRAGVPTGIASHVREHCAQSAERRPFQAFGHVLGLTVEMCDTILETRPGGEGGKMSRAVTAAQLVS